MKGSVELSIMQEPGGQTVQVMSLLVVPGVPGAAVEAKGRVS